MVRERQPVELKDITLQTTDGPIVYEKELLEVIRNTVAKKATPPELYMFLSLANKYGLDPFAKEIWFIKYPSKGKFETRVETSRDGYLVIAKRDPEFMGIQSAPVHENDEFEMEFEMGELKNIHHKFSHKDRGKIVGAWAVAKHATKPNVYEYLPFDESDQGPKTPWGKHPSLMMKKVVESVVLKRIAGISGLVTAEEMGTNVERYTQPARQLESPEDILEAEYKLQATAPEMEEEITVEEEKED